MSASFVRVCHKDGTIERYRDGRCKACMRKDTRERQLRKRRERGIPERVLLPQEHRERVLEWGRARVALGSLHALCDSLGMNYGTALRLIQSDRHGELPRPVEKARSWKENRIPREH